MNSALAAYKEILERASALGIHYAIIRMPEENEHTLDNLDIMVSSYHGIQRGCAEISNLRG
ncbi:MAG: hypothetical protein ABI651_00305 [Verrucomicrobiota bacterium]